MKEKTKKKKNQGQKLRFLNTAKSNGVRITGRPQSAGSNKRRIWNGQESCSMIIYLLGYILVAMLLVEIVTGGRHSHIGNQIVLVLVLFDFTLTASFLKKFDKL